jgi:hypothetical protein
MSYQFTQLALDTFHRANENPLSDGGNWTAIVGDAPAKVLSDACALTVTADVTFCGAMFTGLTWPLNQWASVQLGTLNLTDSGTMAEIFLRDQVSLGTGYTGYFSLGGVNGTFAYLYSNVTSQVLYQAADTFASGDTLTFGVIGNVWVYYHNGALIATGTDTGAPPPSVPGVAGFDFAATDSLSNLTIAKFAGGSMSAATVSQGSLELLGVGF